MGGDRNLLSKAQVPDGTCALIFGLVEENTDAVIATLDARNRIKSRLHDLGISGASFCGLYGLSDGIFSDYMRGKRHLGNQRETEMLALLDRLILFRDALRPFSLPLHDIATTRRLLEHFRRAEITPSVVGEVIAILVGSEQ